MIRIAMACAAALVVVGAFLPWISILGSTRSGLDGDGSITVVLGLFGLLLLWRGWLGQIVQIVLATAICAIAVYDLNGAGGFAASGLYLTFFSSAIWALCAFVARRRLPSG
jgi:hypothetical protein